MVRLDLLKFSKKRLHFLVLALFLIAQQAGARPPFLDQFIQPSPSEAWLPQTCSAVEIPLATLNDEGLKPVTHRNPMFRFDLKGGNGVSVNIRTGRGSQPVAVDVEHRSSVSQTLSANLDVLQGHHGFHIGLQRR